MSERKSWDVQPKRSAPAPTKAPEAPLPRRAVEPIRKQPVPIKSAPLPRSSAGVGAPRSNRQAPTRVTPQSKRSLTERRRGKRRTFQCVLLGITLTLAALLLYALWMPSLRITTVEAQGPGVEPAKQAVMQTLSGTYFFIVPRNSVFLIPMEQVRQAILNAVPEASAVSISRTSFTSLAIVTTPRAGAFLWCGTTIDMPRAEGCYEADVDGLIFKPAPGTIEVQMQNAQTDTASSTDAESTEIAESEAEQTPVAEPAPATAFGSANAQVRIFGTLSKELGEGESPVGLRVVSPSPLQNVLKFVDALRELGAPVTSLSIRGDEADLWLGGPTRIIYVLGRERQAAELAASALPTLNLKNGNYEYIDLRFPGKAYTKKFDE